MSEILEKGILLTFDELCILLYARGVKTVKGVIMPEKEYKEEAVIGTLHRLAKRGLISAKEDAFTIQEGIRRMLDVIGFPEKTFIQRMSDGQECFCYESANMVVVSEHYRKKADTLKLTVFDLSEFHIWREERINDNNRSGSSCVREIL